jgi:hypothetical protein
MPLFKIIEGNQKEQTINNGKQDDHDSWMFSTFEKQQAKPANREKAMMIQEGPADTDMGSFGGIDDFMMHNIIGNQQQYQSHP